MAEKEANPAAGGIADTAVETLRAALRGDLLRRGHAGYDEARRVYNAMIDKHPALIARCVDVADVIAAVNFAREQRLTLAVRGGGHSGPGLGTCDGGLVIDLGRMRGVRVDPAARTVRVEGGATWGDVDHATHAFGLATPSGFVSTTGVGGLTLGGGLGHLTRAHGLTIDNLLGVDVVLADGRFVKAGPGEHPDLFWAVRGGGGNFGVVTSFEYRLHPIDTVYAGPMLWPIERAADLLRFWRDFILKAPETTNAFFVFMVVPPGPPFPEQWHMKKMCGLVCCYTGPLEKADAALAPVRAFSPPAIDLAGPLPFPALQTMFDPLVPPGLRWYWKADFFRELSDEAIALHVQHGPQMPTMLSTAHIYAIDGAAHGAGKSDTAFSFRDANFAEVILGVDPDRANDERTIAWARDYWQALHPHSAGGGYVNMVMDEGEDQVKAAYRENYARLAEIKARYDPGNLFHVNQNIKPAAKPA
jgi:FAD/FMN-containing dehydrogenase